MSHKNNLILSEEGGIYNIKPNVTRQDIITLATQLIDNLFAAADTNAITSPEDTIGLWTNSI